jgi:hypothetical protein
MNTIFPFGFPGATALYLVLYVLTLALHVVFMNYLLAGSFYLGLSALAGRGPAKNESIRSTIADALPFSAGLAITAGVAPLLFLQILYKHRFYTANLLLFHRWMMILPMLIVGFYLLYLIKTQWAKERPKVWAAAAIGSFLSFAFVAWSWTENHLLSRDDKAWVPTYSSGDWVYRSAETLPRLLMWFLGSLATLAVLLCWQLRLTKGSREGIDKDDLRSCAKLGLAGLLLGGLAATSYIATAPEAVLSAARGPMAWPYLAATSAGAILQAIGWLRSWRGRESLGLVTLGLAMSVLGSGVVREVARIAAIDMQSLYAQHQQATQSGALGAFVLIALVNGGIIAFAVRLALGAAKLENADSLGSDS